MRRLGVAAAGALALVGLIAPATNAAAAVPSGARPTSFCSDVKKAGELGGALQTTGKRASGKQLLATVKKLEGEAPAQIRSSFRTIRQYLERVDKVDTRDPRALDRLLKDSSKLEAAAGKVSSYLKDKCHIKT